MCHDAEKDMVVGIDERKLFDEDWVEDLAEEFSEK